MDDLNSAFSGMREALVMCGEDELVLLLEILSDGLENGHGDNETVSWEKATEVICYMQDAARAFAFDMGWTL